MNLTGETVSDETLLQALKKWFGHDGFRDGQVPPIRQVLAGKDTVVVMPTGSGKSLCYQLAAMLLPDTTLVISPLIALMKDQVDALDRLGIPATFLNSSVAPDEMSDRLAALAHGRYKLVYIAPERFRSVRFMETLARTRVSLLTVDEAHCISQWGHDFRPDYLNIRAAMKHFPNVRVMAVTATATPDVRADIIKQLGLGIAPRQEPFVQVQGFERHNLNLSVFRCPTHAVKLSHVLSLIRRYRSGIVYTATRKQAERVYEMLLESVAHTKNPPEVLLYHGALSDDERAHVQEKFTSAEHPVIVATNAFGMGVDRADLRFIAHWDIPGSVEAYYQEVGRAGRDGLPSYCELLFNYADVRTQQFFIDGANPSREDADALFETVRRQCATEPQTISVDDWAEMAGLKNGMEARTLFGIFERAGLITRAQEPGQRTCTTALTPKADAKALDAQFDARGEKSKRDNERLRAMLRFVDFPGCRHTYILRYFGEEVHGDVCGGCDHCGITAPAKPLTEWQWVVVQKVLSCVGRMNGRYSPRRVVQVLRGEADPFLIEKGLTRLSTYGLLKQRTVSFLNEMLNALISTGCVSVSPDEYHRCALTGKGLRVVFRKEPDFTIPWPTSDKMLH
jgi:ATP-dependent DNA helicase RecQ